MRWALRRNRRRAPILQFSRKASPLYTEAALAMNLNVRATNLAGNRRFVLPVADERWKPLGLAPNVHVMASPLFPLCAGAPDNIVLPFLFVGRGTREGYTVQSSPEQLDRLSKYVHSRLRATISVQEIRRIYNDLIDYIDHTVMANSKYASSWSAARAGG